MRGLSLDELFAYGVAGESTNDDVFAEFRDFAGDEVFDGRLRIFDEGLLKKANGAKEFVDFAIDDLVHDVGGFALHLCGGDVAFAGDEVGRDLLTSHIKRMRSRNVESDVFDEIAEDFVFGNEVGFAIDFDEDADFAGEVDVGSNGAFLRFARGLLACAGDAFLAEKILGGGEIATGFGEGFFTIHHPRVGFFAEFFDESC